jgi:murein DD-endopeptidase MepM/ murein hydrolase activator NlpD
MVPAVIVAGAMLAAPVGAQSTKERFEAAKERVAALRSEAQEATARYEAANSRLHELQDQIAATEESLANARSRVTRLQTRLNARAREVYVNGASSTFDLLLNAESFTEFSDRMVFLDRLAQDDADLVARVDVLAEEFKRQRRDLKTLRDEQAVLTRRAERAQDIIYGKLGQAQKIEDKWAKQFRSEQRAAAAAAAAAPSGGSGSISTVSGGALQACPAPGATFTDTFGAPRSGGRSHQGVDMMGNYGMPIYAAQDGNVTHSTSSLGGIQAYVHNSKGFTFYAHLQGYSDASGNVSAGTLIGYMGDTGNATGTPHLHFEYHPGGGAAVNPTPYVAAVC